MAFASATTGFPLGAFLWGFSPQQLGTHGMWVRAGPGHCGRASSLSSLVLWLSGSGDLLSCLGLLRRMFSWVTAP